MDLLGLNCLRQLKVTCVKPKASTIRAAEATIKVMKGAMVIGTEREVAAVVEEAMEADMTETTSTRIAIMIVEEEVVMVVEVEAEIGIEKEANTE